MKTRRQINEAAFRKVRKAQARIKGVQPVRDAKYLSFVRKQPCCVCLPLGCRSTAKRVEYAKEFAAQVFWHGQGSEAAHVGHTGKGMRAKCSDYETVPLCADHHRTGPQSHHKLTKPGEFEKVHRIHFAEIWAELRKVYGGEK